MAELYFLKSNPVDLRDLESLYAMWVETGNPKAADWQEAPAKPAEDAIWAAGQWLIPVITPEPRWVDFGAATMAMPEINVMLGAVLAAAPGLYGGLIVGLQQASQGDSRVFLTSWQSAYAMGLVNSELIATVQQLAADYDLPADFVSGLLPAASQLVRARDELGRFISDDPATTDVDEAWAQPA